MPHYLIQVAYNSGIAALVQQLQDRIENAAASVYQSATA